ncbi:hypothetical protein PF003_g1054 [Phytophthora fragariae]|nr:hypothetical protein PF003_g1054 [Phytophthora fragariae]
MSGTDRCKTGGGGSGSFKAKDLLAACLAGGVSSGMSGH